MTVTLTDLIAAVNIETENLPVHGVATAVGDGVGLSIDISPVGRTILDDNTFVLYVNDVEDTTGSLNYTTGVFTFTSAPAAASDIKAYCNYVYWTDIQVANAINAGLAAMFPDMYVSTSELVTTDGTSFEYTLATANVATVVGVSSVNTDGSDNYPELRTINYATYRDGEDYNIRFFSAPAAGTMRVRTICRAAPLVTDAQELDLPDRAEVPLVSYAAYYLLTQKVAPRIRSDIAAVTTGGRGLSPRQMNDAANSYYFRYQTQLQGVKMFPWKY
jgi:hypothetical protein